MRACIPGLCPELCERRPVLEQPSPPFACGGTGERTGALGQSGPALLAFADSLHDPVNRPGGRITDANGCLRERAHHGGHELLLAARISRRLQRTRLELAVGDRQGRKGKLSFWLYVAAIGLAFAAPWLFVGLYIAISAVWFIPDRRIERLAAKQAEHGSHRVSRACLRPVAVPALPRTIRVHRGSGRSAWRAKPAGRGLRRRAPCRSREWRGARECSGCRVRPAWP